MKKIEKIKNLTEGLISYQNLNDAKKYNVGLSHGITKIYYLKKGADFGYAFGKLKPNKDDMLATHVLLGEIKETNLNRIYQSLQGEFWSPNGEAVNLIKKLNTGHTSMSIGDVIVMGNDYYLVVDSGFEKF